ncbi:MAG: hypothetical protein KAF64_16060 [Hydrogenophaga sp.]|uniref:hypothetical protein n=1 Tax=Hydrogenophaga sp. TaxID=1904254 RepID=UPI0025C1A1CF|nr:hypothetical protein [Hydrogenophaga sp.]MBU7574873.1 hypothetical protein [Hydrogenophaga sp.]
MRIGFESDTGHVYEGASAPQFAVLPPPLLSQAKLITNPEDWSAPPKGLFSDPFAWVFREDSFDTVTRVRRGRLFQPQSQSQPESVLTAGHPLIENALRSVAGGGRTRRLYTYMPCTAVLHMPNGGLGQTLLIGQVRGSSAWRVIQAEMVRGDDVMLTLKAQSAFGVLPELALSAIPEADRAAVRSAVDRVLDSAFRETPVSIIDQCRNAMTVVLSRWLVADTGDSAFAGKDLAALAKAMETVNPSKQCAAWVGQLLARLHVRGKSNEQVSRALRLPVEEDAELCLHNLGFLLRELGWAH